VFTEPLPSNERGDTHILNYAVDMGSVTMICMHSFRNVGLGIKKVTEGFHRHTDIVELA
jgi:hypothetical protein